MTQYLVEVNNYELETTDTVICLSKSELATVISKLSVDEELGLISIIDNAIKFSDWMENKRNDTHGDWNKIHGN